MIDRPSTNVLGKINSGTVKYSICITHYNNVKTLRKSLESILTQIDENFEVVVVDSISNDGSKAILEQFASNRKIKLVERKTSRGLGRQLALKNSVGEYVIANLDMDDVFKHELANLISFYHKMCEGRLLRAAKGEETDKWTQNVTIAPRVLLTEIGGWPDLQLYEDWYLWARSAKIGKYSWAVFPLAENETIHPERTGKLGTLRFRYLRYRESMRLGRSVFKKGEKVSIAQRFAKILASSSMHFYKSYEGNVDLNFDPYDKSFRIQ